MLARAAGMDLTPIHYKGGAPAVQALLGGQTPISINPEGEMLPYVQSGKLRVLAVTGSRRSRFLPDVPTMAESGYKDLVVDSWLGFFVPARTPSEIVARLSNAIAEALKSRDVAETITKSGNEVAYAGPAELTGIIRADTERWGPVVKASGFTAED